MRILNTCYSVCPQVHPTSSRTAQVSSLKDKGLQLGAAPRHGWVFASEYVCIIQVQNWAKRCTTFVSMPSPTPVLDKVCTNSWACILFILLFKDFAFCKLSTTDDEVLNVLVLPDLFMLKLVGQRYWKAFGPLREVLFCKKQCLMLLVPLATSGYSVQVCFHFTIHPERIKTKIQNLGTV